MNENFPNREQRKIVEIIEALGFGQIESLVIREGLPVSEPAPRIVQSFKLDSPTNRVPTSQHPPATIKQEFRHLFDQLRRVRDGVVDIEVRHGLPFRLVASRSVKEL